MVSSETSKTTYDFSRASRWGLKGRMVSNTALLGGARILGGILGFITLIVAARGLGNEVAFGTLLFLHAYMLFFSDVASCKTWQAIIRFGADEVKNEDAPRLGALIKTGLTIDAFAALGAFLLSAGLFGVYMWLQDRIGWGTKTDVSSLLTYDMIILYCTVILFRQVNVAIGIFRLFDKFSVLALRALVMPLIRFVGVLIAENQGWGLKGYVVVWFLASLLSYLTLQIFAVFEIARRGLWPAIRKAAFCRSEKFEGLYPFIIKTNIDSTVKSLKKNFPNIAVMLVFGPALYAVYHVAREMSRILSRSISLFDQVLYPELSRMAVDLHIRLLFKTMVKTAIGIGVVGFSVASIVLFFGENILELAFNSSYKDAPTLAVLLLLSTSLVGIAVPFYTVFYVLVRPGTAIFIRFLGTAAFVVLFFILADCFGLFAIGWAAIAGACIEVILAMFLAIRLIRHQKARDTIEKQDKSDP